MIEVKTYHCPICKYTSTIPWKGKCPACGDGEKMQYQFEKGGK